MSITKSACGNSQSFMLSEVCLQISVVPNRNGTRSQLFRRSKKKHNAVGIAIGIGIEIGFRQPIAQFKNKRPMAIATPIAIPIAIDLQLGFAAPRQ